MMQAEAIEYEVSNKNTPEIVDKIRVDFVSNETNANGISPNRAKVDTRSTFFSKYPTESLTYAYSANLKTSTTYSSNSTVATQLAGAGFSATSGTNASKYYYRIVSETGTIDLY